MIISGIPKARSPQCLGGTVTLEGIQPCAKCSRLTLDVKIIRERATRSFEHIRNHDDLNADQLHAKVTVVKDKVNTLKLKNLNLERSVQCAQAQLAEWRELFSFIGQNSIPALHRLLANANKEGWSPVNTLEHCQLAKAGKYTARNYTDYEINLAILLYELGGGAAVHAMNHSIFALPSRNTIQPYRQDFKLIPSVSGLRFTDISQNITTLFGSHPSREGESDVSPPEKCGHTLSLDELAADPRIDFMPETDEMGGLCLEHLSELETVKVGKDLQAVEAAVAAVKAGKVHVSHEVCVGAISHLYGTNYGAKPIFMGLTCKKGPWQDSVRLIEVIIAAWKRSPDGEAKHGPLMSISTDGDHKRRLALFILCMQNEILPGNPLYPFVCKLPGLNLRVGKGNITHDGDPKHIFKRNRSLLSSSDGVVVKNVCINRDLLLVWLARLPNQDWSETSIHNLLHPSDGQNVSEAIKLLLCIVEISKLDPEDLDLDPSEAAEFEALCLLGEAYNALLQPFINVELSLSEQIQSLITASHLFCALYIQNGTSFMSNQLYADMQSMFKNTVLMVPKTRIINGELKVYICLLGDDVLEALFGRCRMIGGHSPNCSIGELRDRFGSAMNLDHIYERHPELERHPPRLNMIRKRHVDHLRPAHFKRELRAKSCDLESCWGAAVVAAEHILTTYGVRMNMSFSQRFGMKDTDLSRPLGGKYPAISGGIDRSLANLNTSSSSDELIDPNTIHFANLVAGVDIDAMLLAEKVSESSSTALPRSLFAEIDATGRLAHKKSILRTFFNTTTDGHTSHDRLQRVRGFTIGNKTWDRDVESEQDISAATHFQLGNLFTTLLCHNGTHLGLAVAKSTLIKRIGPGSKAVSVSAVPRAELHLPSSFYSVSGQVLSLVPLPGPPSDDLAWAWDGDFIAFSLKKNKNSGEEITHRRNLQFTVSSRLIDCNIQDGALDISTSNLPVDLPGTRERTWSFQSSHFLAAWNFLWSILLNDPTLHDKFPIFTGVSEGAFPYQIEPNLTFRFEFGSAFGPISEPNFPNTTPIAKTAIEESIRSRKACRICTKPVKDQDRQGHTGEHILKALCKVPDSSVKVPVSGAYPCGMCGGSCGIAIKGGKPDSDCPSLYHFLIKTSKKFLPTRPCTNVPIVCAMEGCKDTHWKYNFMQHMNERHPDWHRLVPSTFVEEIRISSEEQLKLGIPSHIAAEWPPPRPPPTRPSTPTAEKRPASSLPLSPRRSHGRDKENYDPYDTHSFKKSRII
ncbi:hypothetical protein R3P38DRAFT_3504625 [Favolaschia claudopus]|uniref:Uncharacterized protein n=1 Tax=Favolaschia claudopus TaxID=2862362 RepID=A0AAV9Z2T6_9AGAR